MDAFFDGVADARAPELPPGIADNDDWESALALQHEQMAKAHEEYCKQIDANKNFFELFQSGASSEEAVKAINNVAPPMFNANASRDKGKATVNQGAPAIEFDVAMKMIPEIVRDVPPALAMAMLGGDPELTAAAMGVFGDHKSTVKSEVMMSEGQIPKAQPPTMRHAAQKKRKKPVKAESNGVKVQPPKKTRKKRDQRCVRSLREHIAQFPDLIRKVGLKTRKTPNKSGCTTYYGRIPTMQKLDGNRKKDLTPEERAARRRTQNRIAACRTRARKRLLKEELAKRMGKKLAKKGRPRNEDRHNLVFFDQASKAMQIKQEMENNLAFMKINAAEQQAILQQTKEQQAFLAAARFALSQQPPKSEPEGQKASTDGLPNPANVPPPELMMAALANPELLFPMLDQTHAFDPAAMPPPPGILSDPAVDLGTLPPPMANQSDAPTLPQAMSEQPLAPPTAMQPVEPPMAPPSSDLGVPAPLS